MSGARGQSEVVGVVLLLGFTLVVGGVTVALGTETVSHAGDHASVQQAESALSQFDSATSDVALGSSHAKRVDLGSANGNVRVTDSGTLSVTTTNLLSSNETKRTLAHVRLGAVVFTRGGATVAYQGGGVWRDGQIVSPPEIHYDGGTLTLPIVSVNGTGNTRGNGGLTVTRASPTRSVFPTAKLQNPMSAKRVNITVQSPYCTGWAQYFRTRTAGTVTACDASNSTTLTLTDPAPNTPVNSGIIATGGTPNIKKNTGADTYNSSEGPYPNSTISNTSSSVSNAITYATPNGVGVPTHIAGLRRQNNNSSLPPGVRNGTGGNVSAGSYYLNKLTVNSGKTLVLNTTNGSINLAVNGDMEVNGRIEVVGKHRMHRVNIYTESYGMGQGSTVNVSGDRADRFWLYVSPSGRKVPIEKNVNFTGVLYGSGGSSAPGPTIKINKGSSVYGAVVGNLKIADKDTAFHYDTALRDTPVNPTAATEHPPAISYLHVTVENITVSDAR